MDDFIKDFLARENNDSIEYLREIDRYDNFMTIVNQKNKEIEQIANELFVFSLDYGVLFLTKYLYEIVGVSYDLKLFNRYMYLYDSEEHALATNKQPIETQISEVAKINIFYEDRHSNKRLECINYLCDMKRMSHCYYNKGFHYVFNKKNETTI